MTQTLADATERAYRGPITLFLMYLREALGRAPDLNDFTIETVRAWTACLRAQPKTLGGIVAEGNPPIALALSRTYPRTRPVFAELAAQATAPLLRGVATALLQNAAWRRDGEGASRDWGFRKLVRAAEHDRETASSARARAPAHPRSTCRSQSLRAFVRPDYW